MNNGMISENEKDLLARVDHLEKTLPFLARLVEQQQLIIIVDDLKKSLQNLEESYSIYKNDGKQILNEFSSLTNQIAVDQKLLKNVIDEIQTKDLIHQNDVKFIKENFDAKFYESNSKIDILEKCLQNLKEEIVNNLKVVQLESDVSKLEKKFVLFTKKVEEHVNSFQDLKNKYEKDCVEKEILRRDIDFLNDKIINFQECILQLQKSINLLENSFVESIQKSQKSILKEMDNKILDIPKPVELDLEDIKLSVAKDVELYALDSKNALLKSSINENKLVVLEKKVEQLFLMQKIRE